MMSSWIVIEKHMASFMQEFALIIPTKRNELEWVRNPLLLMLIHGRKAL